MESEASGSVENSNSQIKKLPLPQKSAKEQIKKERGFVNSNGFSQRPTIYQIIPIVFALLMFSEIIIVCLFIDSLILRITLMSIYSVAMTILIILWISATRIDPSDSIQILHRQSIKNEVPFNCTLHKYYCHFCQTFVSKDSFHCRKCNRCVQIFDHHCKWLNNCIGAKNYLQFLGLIAMVEIVLILHIVVNVLHLCFVTKTNFTLLWIFYLEISFIVLDSIPSIVNFILISLHIYLIFKKKTTLQIILQKRRENKIFPSKIQSEKPLQQKSSHITPISYNQQPNNSKNRSIKIKLKQIDYSASSLKKEQIFKKKLRSFNVTARNPAT